MPHTISLGKEPPPSSEQGDRQEALSLYELARRQPTKRILVEPLLWTQLHLETLRCTFSTCSPAPSAMMDIQWHQDRGPGRTTPALVIRDFERSFFGHQKFWEQREYTTTSFLTDDPSPLSPHYNLPLKIGGNRSTALPCTYYCLGHVPVAAFVDFQQFVGARHIRAGMMPRRMTRPTINLYDLRIKKVTPAEPLHDPYLVAILIALGQRQWWQLEQQGTRGAASGVKPRLLFVSEDLEHIHVYSTNISASFIRMFEYPNMKPPSPASLSVQIRSFPCRPIETLRGRLLAHLLSATKLEDVGTPESLIAYTLGDS